MLSSLATFGRSHKNVASTTDPQDKVSGVTLSEDPVKQTFEAEVDLGIWRNIKLLGRAGTEFDSEDPEVIARRSSLNINASTVSKVANLLATLEDTASQDWLIPSNKIVYLQQYHLSLSEPYLGIVLPSKYLAWPQEVETLPALFMSLSSGRPGASLVLPNADHTKVESMKATEQMAFNLSPGIGAVLLPEELARDFPGYEEGDLCFIGAVEDFKAAVRYYHDSLSQESRLLAYFLNHKFPTGAETMLFRFRMPKLLSKASWPIVKGLTVKDLVQLKLSLFCRDYLQFQDY